MNIESMNDIETKYSELLQENARLKEDLKAAKSSGQVFTHIAHALARDYTDLFYVNMETADYIEYHTDEEHGVLVERRRASGFFDSCKYEATLYVHEDDREMFINAMNHDFLTEELKKNGSFEMTYRRLKYDKMFYVQMNVSPMHDGSPYIVIATWDVDELVKQRREEERIQEERIVYARLHAITGNFIVVYVVDPETDFYREFSSISAFSESFLGSSEGPDFYNVIRNAAAKQTYPEDLNKFLSVFTKENILSEIKRNGIFTFDYRFMLQGRVIHVQLKVAMVEEKEGPRLIVERCSGASYLYYI